MSAIRTTGNTYLEAASLAAIESATQLFAALQIRGQDLKAVNAGSSTTLAFRFGGANKLRINVEDAGGGADVGFVVTINNGAASEAFSYAKASLNDADYYLLYFRGGAAGIRGRLKDSSNATLAESSVGATTALATGAGSGLIQLVRPGGFSTNNPGASIAGFAVSASVDINNYDEPATGDVLALCRMDNLTSGLVTSVVGNNFQAKDNSGNTTSGVTLLSGEGPWNGEGGGGGSAIAAISSGYHIRGMR